MWRKEEEMHPTVQIPFQQAAEVLRMQKDMRALQLSRQHPICQRVSLGNSSSILWSVNRPVKGGTVYFRAIQIIHMHMQHCTSVLNASSGVATCRQSMFKLLSLLWCLGNLFGIFAALFRGFHLVAFDILYVFDEQEKESAFSQVGSAINFAADESEQAICCVPDPLHCTV